MSNRREQRSKRKGRFCTHVEIFFILKFPQEAGNGHLVQWEVIHIDAHLSRLCPGLGDVPLVRQNGAKPRARSPAWDPPWALPGISLQLHGNVDSWRLSRGS